jgi:poly-gamma-glutamate synthesis protein (capsule biosynthesis protein)
MLSRAHIRARLTVTVLACALVGAAACSSGSAALRPSTPAAPSRHGATPASTPPATSPATSAAGEPAGEFTVNFAGDVHFEGRVADRLAADVTTVFGQAQPVLDNADLTMVNLETAITTGGDQQGKQFTFRAPPSAFTALRDAGVDVATMANNHGADYGASGLRDTVSAIARTHFPVVGIGADAAQAYAPYTTTLNGVRVAILAASQVQEETLANFSAGPSSAGIANAFSPELVAAVKAAKAAGNVVIVYIHWGTEYVTCPNANQQQLAATLAQAGATAVIGTHAHVLQGAGWRSDGVFVEYGLGNYLWWRSFGNNQDDNGVLTLTFRRDHVIADKFHPSRLDDRGVPMPATGAEYNQIMQQWNQDRACTGLSASPPK